MENVRDSKSVRDNFIWDRNIVVFQHFSPGVHPDEDSTKTIDVLKRYIINKDQKSLDSFNYSLKYNFRNSLKKFAKERISRHLKVIYIFFTEGYYDQIKGDLNAGQYEEKIKQGLKECITEIKQEQTRGITDKNGILFRKFSPDRQEILFRKFKHEPIPDEQDIAALIRNTSVIIVGTKELSGVLGRAAMGKPPEEIKNFLLGKNQSGGYDTPKIASSVIQLARLKYFRQEMFIRIDDDVEPNETGLIRLKEKYYDLVHSKQQKMFCMSWNYEEISEKWGIKGSDGPHYDTLFSHYVNSYSIRTTFMSTPDLRCKPDQNMKIIFENRNGKPVNEKDRANLNIIATQFFIQLFKQGKWGSDMRDPISGAGMCFSPESLKDLPPWCNIDEMISWIDDFIKKEMMEIYYGNKYDRSTGLLIRESGQGFPQNRNKPEDFKIKDVKWAVPGYLDRLLMGCILAFAVNPKRYNSDFSEGFGSLLNEKNHLIAAKLRWESELRDKLYKGAKEHLRNILMDWRHYFCDESYPSKPGYIANPPQKPDGFAPAPADAPFNAYTIVQLIKMSQGNCDLVDKVFNVLDRYLTLKYEFWPHVTASIEEIADRHIKDVSKPDKSKADEEFEAETDWLFVRWECDKNEYPNEKRKSEAAIALITRPNQSEWLVQWNPKWKKMNFVSGHIEKDDPNDIACLVREIHEELFSSLDQEQLREMRNFFENSENRDGCTFSDHEGWKKPLTSIKKMKSVQYTEFSQSKNEWTDYVMAVFEVELSDAGKSRLFHEDVFYTPLSRTAPKAVNEWVSKEDIEKGFTRIGRPISPTVKLLFDKIASISKKSDIKKKGCTKA